MGNYLLPFVVIKTFAQKSANGYVSLCVAILSPWQEIALVQLDCGLERHPVSPMCD